MTMDMPFLKSHSLVLLLATTLGIESGQTKAILAFLAKDGVRCCHLWLLSPGAVLWLDGSTLKHPIFCGQVAVAFLRA